MIVIGGVVFGAIYGALLAKKRGGVVADMAQYGAGFAMALGLLGFFITIFIERLY